MKTTNPVFLCLFILLWSVSFNAFGQGTTDKPDLRNPCKNKEFKCPPSNYSILNVYFSNSTGAPSNVCDKTGPYFLSILYTSNAAANLHNFRIIANILKKETGTNSILENYYINEYIGTIPSCRNNTCIITVPIVPPINFNCLNEYYELSNPMVVWTNSAKENLKDKYECNDYNPSQCFNGLPTPIEVGGLDFAFEPVFECYQEDINQTNISFNITKLFGGNPTLPYEITWTFQLPDGTIKTSDKFSPTPLNNNTSGQVIIATLTVKQGALKREPEEEEEISITVPIALTETIVIENSTVIDSDDGEDNGFIEVEFKPGNYFYYWTSADDPEFYSDEPKIENLPPGTYTLTTFDESSGLCRTDSFSIANILPVDFLDLEVNYLPDSKATSFKWSTAKEWENSHFEVERAVDAVDKFVKIDEVEGMGWKDTITEYEYTDTQLPLGKAMLYYRLKQVDFDGSAIYSRTLSVATPGLQFTQGVWRAHPNPFTSNTLQVSLLDTEQYANEELAFRLIQPTSATRDLTVRSVEELNEKLHSQLGAMGKGIIILEIRWASHIEHLKILKQ